MFISIKTHITCDFPEWSGPPVPPLDPRMFEQSLPLEVSTSIPRVPVIATRKYPESQAL